MKFNAVWILNVLAYTTRRIKKQKVWAKTAASIRTPAVRLSRGRMSRDSALGLQGPPRAAPPHRHRRTWVSHSRDLVFRGIKGPWTNEGFTPTPKPPKFLQLFSEPLGHSSSSPLPMPLRPGSCQLCSAMRGWVMEVRVGSGPAAGYKGYTGIGVKDPCRRLFQGTNAQQQSRAVTFGFLHFS